MTRRANSLLRALILAAGCAAPPAALAQAPKPDAPPVPSPLSLAPAPMIRTGSYAVTGIGADGVAYEGTLELRATGPHSWRLTWTIDGETVEGVGISIGNRLVYGYVLEGEPGAGFFEPQMDGRLRGRWIPDADGDVGTETLTPQ